MGRLENRVVIVTGAGRGLGRAHARDLASRGAAVVVNDVGLTLAGEADADGSSLAERVAAEIRAAGGQAVASTHDVADWEQAEALVATAIETFGELHALINNAGILRDQTLANLEESNWDEVIRVHLKGHAAPTRHAAAHWRRRAKAGADLKPAVVFTTSVAGFCGHFGQSAYSAAKAAVLALSKVAAIEGASYGLRSNAVSPSARTRFTMTMPGAAERLREPEQEGEFDWFDPANVSPLFSWLVDEHCPANGQVFHVGGNRIFVVSIPVIEHVLEHEGRWTFDALDDRLAHSLAEPAGIEDFLRRDGVETTLP